MYLGTIFVVQWTDYQMNFCPPKVLIMVNYWPIVSLILLRWANSDRRASAVNNWTAYCNEVDISPFGVYE